MKSEFDDKAEQSAAVAKLLSHPARIMILKLLANQKSCQSNEFFSQIPLSRGSVNQHLTALRESGWVQSSVNGTQVQYCLDVEQLKSDLGSLSFVVNDLLSVEKLTCEVAPKKENVLFLCTGNSCRSQMSEAFFNEYSQEMGFEAFSAGTTPASEIHPLAVQVMAEKGIEFKGQAPKNVKEFLGKKSVRLVFFVCDEAEKNCPYIFPFTQRKVKMPFDDPASFVGSPEETLQKFREVRDNIEVKIKTLIDELKIGA